MKKDFIFTNDKVIRCAIKAALTASIEKDHENYPNVKIIEELGIAHGAVRVDIAVVNGSIHGYELKSDLDTLERLPEQMKFYNEVLDKVTLVVGKNHLHEAIRLVPEWWGIMVAKILDPRLGVALYEIREAQKNPVQNNVLVAALLWREEALSILEEYDQAKGVRSKTRHFIYERLAEVVEENTLKARVRESLCVREGWRPDLQYMLSGD